MIDKLIGLNSSLTSTDIDKFWTFENKDLNAELITKSDKDRKLVKQSNFDFIYNKLEQGLESPECKFTRATMGK